ncbi:hypothetical protein CHARACLAT_016042 [Characodon lateralis]|uniref:Uncharacterized protein n=1 Tax=Characodon lateralis TaxID=208331 RepID=A0ABU7CZZ5_9TELE|nr:hypothetical protein [Characodon lateralis]
MCDLMPASQPAEKMGKMKKLRRTLSESFRSIAFKKEDSSFDEFPVDPDGTWCIWCVMYSCVELSETSLRVSRHHRTALACQEKPAIMRFVNRKHKSTLLKPGTGKNRALGHQIVMGPVVGGVCPVAPVVGVALRGALAARCVVGEQGAAGLLRAGLCVELALCGCGFSATEFTCGGGDSWRLGGMCSISVSLLGVALWGGSCWGSLGVGDSWGWDRSSWWGRDFSVLGRLQLTGWFEPCGPSFIHSPPSGGGWGMLGTGFGAGGREPGRGHPGLGGAGAVCLSLPQEGRGPPPGSEGWLPLGATGGWTWECRVCMGSVSECMTSIVVCLYVGLGLGLLPLLDQLRPPWGAYFLPATLPASGWSLCPLMYLWFLVSGARCFGVCWLTASGFMLGPGPLGSIGPLLGGWCVPGSWASGSMAGSAQAWTAASGACGLIAAAPWGFCTVAAGWLPWDSPLLSSGGVVVVQAVVLLGFLCFGRPLDVCGSDLLSVHPGTM